MNKTMNYVSATLFLFMIALQLNGQDGKSGSSVRDVAGFTFIEFDMGGTMYVNQGNEFHVKVEASPEVIDQITTTVASNTLYVRYKGKNNYKPHAEVKIHVTLPQINGLTVSGSGKMIMQTDISSKLLTCTVGGSGSLSLLEVTAGKLNLKLDGSGDLRQTKATAENAIIELHGSGNASFGNLTAKLIAVTLNGSGNLTLSDIASSKLHVSNNGSGSIKDLKGVAGEVLIENGGSGDVSGSGLNGSSISVINTGSGNISVGSCETLNAQITGSGNIRYQGVPKNIMKDVSGSGQVFQN